VKRAVVAFVLAAAAGYGIARFAGSGGRAAADGTSAPVGFAAGGLVSPDDAAGSAAVMAGLAARHCADRADDFPIPREQIAPSLPWAGALVATVYCPGADAVSRESLRGFWGRCDGGRADLYVRVGNRSIDDLAGCLVAAGVDNLSPLAPDDVAPAVQPGDRVRAAFRADARIYAWVERDDPDGGTRDLFLPAEPKAP
jgi:hypothetical protein